MKKDSSNPPDSALPETKRDNTIPSPDDFSTYDNLGRHTHSWHPMVKLPYILTEDFADLNTPNVFFSDSEILFCGEHYYSVAAPSGLGVRSHYFLTYVQSGKGIFRTRNTVYHLSAGATYVAFPGEQVFYMADEEDPWHCRWVAFEGEYFGGILKRAEITPATPVVSMPKNKALPELYKNLLVYAASQRSCRDIKLISLTMDILYQYLEHSSEPREPIEMKPQTDHVNRGVDYICSHSHEDISVSSVAEILGISADHFSELFKKEYSISPAKFIRNYRLQRAMILLTSTDFSIEQIAKETGFHSYNYFSNQFKNMYRISPSKLRKVEPERQNVEFGL